MIADVSYTCHMILLVSSYEPLVPFYTNSLENGEGLVEFPVCEEQCQTVAILKGHGVSSAYYIKELYEVVFSHGLPSG